jgi:PHD/YefM family antitoxin component YafN of YafNO toxin-antitoxin module
MQVRPEEFIGTRELSRNLHDAAERLESGEVEKLVVLGRNRPRFVMLTLGEYERLVSRPAPGLDSSP